MPDPVPAALAPQQASEGGQMIPEAIRTMLDAAIASGNDSDVAVITKYAREADPLSGDAVQAVADKWRADRSAAQRAVIQQASFLDLWRGRFELGGYLTTGNSDTKGATGSAELTREGVRWRHKFRFQADYSESLGIATREHYLAGYELNYKVSDRAYLYGNTGYESDRFLGYDGRVTASTGIGYSALKSAAFKLDLEAGPAFRQTSFTNDIDQSSIAGRGSVDFAWRLTPALSITQVAAGYLERYNSTVTSTSAISAKLLGPLSAQLSYLVQYESRPPEPNRTTDTTTRASLVYSF